jgi:hypothetical protein
MSSPLAPLPSLKVLERVVTVSPSSMASRKLVEPPSLLEVQGLFGSNPSCEEMAE